MRICLHTVREVRPDFIGGTERLLVETARELATLGHDPFIVSSGLHSDLEVGGIPIIQRMPARYARPYLHYGVGNSAFIGNEVMQGATVKERLIALGGFVDEQFADIEADVRHLNSFSSSIFSKSARGAIVTNHENDREYDAKFGAGFTREMARIAFTQETELRHAALLTTPSHHYADFYSNAFGIPVATIRGGVGLTRFERRRRKLAAARRPPARRPLEVLLPARFEPFQKGHDIAMQACRILKDLGRPATFVFSGMRKDYEKRFSDFQAMARALGVSAYVKAKKYVDISTAYDTCDVVISPERYCSFGLAISESLSLGIPTVLSDIPTYLEIAAGYEHARFFRNEDPEDLARRILEAADVPSDVADREAIRFRISNDLRAVALELHQRYNQLIQNNNAS